MKKIWILCFLLISLFGCTKNTKETIKADSMFVKKDSNIYKERNDSSKKEAKAFFGQKLDVIRIEKDWVKITGDNQEGYIPWNNLAYETKTINEEKVKIYDETNNSEIGYAYFGTEVEYYSEVKIENKMYSKCCIPNVYNSKNELVESEFIGLIQSNKLKDSTINMVVKKESSLFDKNKKKNATILEGESVEVLFQYGKWANVMFEGKSYLMKIKDLEYPSFQIKEKKVFQTQFPNPNSKKLHTIYWDTQVDILDEFQSEKYGDYYYCKRNGDYGFVKKPSDLSNNGIRYLKKDENLYEKASTTSNVLDRYESGSEVMLLHRYDTWSYVSIDSNIGYISNRALTYEQYSLSGKEYTSAYKLCVDKGGVEKEEDNVNLLSLNEDLGVAKVRLASNDIVFTSSMALYKPEKLRVNDIKMVLYQEPNLESTSIQIPYLTEITYRGEYSVDETGSWLRILYNGKIYYTWQDIGTSIFDTYTWQDNYTPNTFEARVIDKLIDIEQNWETEYKHKQSNGVLNENGVYGFDCSGLVAYVINGVLQDYVPTYRIYANTLKLLAADVIYNEGLQGQFIAENVSYDNLRAGDVLLFNIKNDSPDYDPNRPVNHCGIYIGNGEFIHCTHTWNKVIRMPFTGFYTKTLVGIKRFIPDYIISADTPAFTINQKNRVYAQKNKNSTVLCTLEEETKITVLFTDSNWAYITVNENGKNIYGFISLKNLTYENLEIEEQKYVSKLRLKLHDEPKSESSFVEVYVGNSITYLGKYKHTNYHKVTLGDGIIRYVYIPDDNIYTCLADDLGDVFTYSQEMTITSRVNLRSTPSTSSDNNIIVSMPKEDTVILLFVSDIGNWGYVQYEDYAGFVSMKYLE